MKVKYQFRVSMSLKQIDVESTTRKKNRGHEKFCSFVFRSTVSETSSGCLKPSGDSLGLVPEKQMIMKRQDDLQEEKKTSRNSVLKSSRTQCKQAERNNARDSYMVSQVYEVLFEYREAVACACIFVKFNVVEREAIARFG